MSTKEAQARAKRNYRAKCKTLYVTLYPTDEDIRRKVESVENYSGYIKDLIRADIERERE